MRLNKYLAACGIASRRKAEELIDQGKVMVNNKVVQQQGIIINPDKDIVKVNNKKCSLTTDYIYLALNKPRGYVCTHARFKDERSIIDLLPKKYANLKIAGRLDKNSEGLVLLSNDGDFIYQLTHPKYKHEKEYEVILDKKISSKDITILRQGIKLKEGLAKLDSLRYIKQTKYHLILHQGWKRQLRRMFENLNYKVVTLKRIREEKFILGAIRTGDYKKIRRSDIV